MSPIRARISAIPLLVALACGAPPSDPGPAPERGSAWSEGEPLVLYLHQALPPEHVQFSRVNRRASDFGSLSPHPPEGPEDRSCSTVVAFGAAQGATPAEGMHVHEVLYRVWWFSGSGRGSFSLHVPGIEGGLAPLPVSVFEGERPRPGGYALAKGRVPVDRWLDGEQLRQLVLTLDVAQAAVRIPTCAARRSMIVLNPPSDEALAGRDKDHDGHDDLDELLESLRDPFASDPESVDCLGETDALRLPVTQPIRLPRPDRRLNTAAIRESMVIQDEVVAHAGDLAIASELRLERATLLLEPDPDTGKPPKVTVSAGGSLKILAKSTLAAPDSRVGFHVLVDPDATLEMSDCTVANGGFIALDAQGRVGVETAAIYSTANHTRVLHCDLAQNLMALSLIGDDARVEHNRFRRNGTGVLLSGSGATVSSNRSLGDGIFLTFDARSSGNLVRDNEVHSSADAAVRIRPADPPNQLLDNRMLDVNVGINLLPAEPPGAEGRFEVKGNTVRSCRQSMTSPPGWDLAPFEADNTLERSTDSACPKDRGSGPPPT